MRQFKAIFDDLRVKVVFDRNLADEMATYAAKHKVEVYDEFIAADRGLLSEVLAAWTAPEARTYIARRMAKLLAATAKPEKVENTIDKAAKAAQKRREKAEQDAAFRDLSLKLIGGHFVASFEGNYQPYQIVDFHEHILEPMNVMHLEDRIAHAIKDECEDRDIILNSGILHTMTDYWRFYAPRIEPPTLRNGLDEPGWCLSKATIRPDPTIPCPTWMSFYNRLNDPEAAGAYIAGVYYRLNPMGRQVLWITALGEDGKSRWLAALTRLIGSAVTKSISHEQLKGKHFSAAFSGKVLAIVPDNMNSKLLLTGAFKEITGRDRVSVEEKFKNPRDVEMDVKAIIIGNVDPVITGERHNQTRTLWVKLDRLPAGTEIDPHWEDKLDAEAPGMLAWALECYRRRCQKDYVIVPNAAVRAAMATKVHEYEERFTLVFDRYYVLDPAGRVMGADLYERLTGKDGPNWTDQEVSNWKRWLRARYDIEPTHCDGKHYYPGMRDKGPRDRINGGTPSSSDTLMETAEIRSASFTTSAGPWVATTDRTHH